MSWVFFIVTVIIYMFLLCFGTGFISGWYKIHGTKPISAQEQIRECLFGGFFTCGVTVLMMYELRHLVQAPILACTIVAFLAALVFINDMSNDRSIRSFGVIVGERIKVKYIRSQK